MLRIFKNAWFNRFARRERIGDAALTELIARIAKGAIDADLGGHVIKQRMARPGQGKSGGYRTIIIFRQADKAFFVYGFAKKELENINEDELKAFKQTAKELLALSEDQIEQLIKIEGLTEIES
ncbi:MAG: hypothetical protein ACI906_002103 [Candidatus Latescibacterota bacterium]|jgi:hypothetical protein